MDAQPFAQAFGDLYRQLYGRAGRCIDDARDAPSAETVALLLHLAQAVPLTLSELAHHLDRPDPRATALPRRTPVNTDCQSCGMPIGSGRYGPHCVDAPGPLQDFDTPFERVEQWALRESPGRARAAAEQQTLACMARMWALSQHPRVQARQAS